MHHSLYLYNRSRKYFLHLYISLAQLTRVPLVGRFALLIANTYGKNGHGGYVLTLNEAEQIIDAARSVSLGPCSCRQAFHNCDNPLMTEIVLGTNEEEYSHREPSFRTISREEAKEVMRESHRRKLTHGIMRCGRHFYAICNCCTCCCVPTRLRLKYGIGQALIRSNNVLREFKEQLT